MKRFALCLMLSLSLGAAAADKVVPAGTDAKCVAACNSTNKGCAAACLKSAACISSCTASQKVCVAGCKK